MARSIIVLAALLAVFGSAWAQPLITDITGMSSYTVTMDPASYGATVEQNLTLTYASLNVPFNAWWVNVNVSTTGCTDYSQNPPVQMNRTSSGPMLEAIMQRYLPCNYHYTQNIFDVSTQPGTVCYSLSGWAAYKYETL